VREAFVRNLAIFGPWMTFLALEIHIFLHKLERKNRLKNCGSAPLKTSLESIFCSPSFGYPRRTSDYNHNGVIIFSAQKVGKFWRGRRGRRGLRRRRGRRHSLVRCLCWRHSHVRCRGLVIRPNGCGAASDFEASDFEASDFDASVFAASEFEAGSTFEAGSGVTPLSVVAAWSSAPTPASCTASTVGILKCAQLLATHARVSNVT
jgi:hypothetical protein